jgi:hypothetical protein
MLQKPALSALAMAVDVVKTQKFMIYVRSAVVLAPSWLHRKPRNALSVPGMAQGRHEMGMFTIAVRSAKVLVGLMYSKGKLKSVSHQNANALPSIEQARVGFIILVIAK